MLSLCFLRGLLWISYDIKSVTRQITGQLIEPSNAWCQTVSSKTYIHRQADTPFDMYLLETKNDWVRTCLYRDRINISANLKTSFLEHHHGRIVNTCSCEEITKIAILILHHFPNAQSLGSSAENERSRLDPKKPYWWRNKSVWRLWMVVSSHQN